MPLLAVHEPVRQRRHCDCANDQHPTDVLTALLPDEDAQHDPAHAEDGEHGAHDVDPTGTGVGTRARCRSRPGRSR